MIYVPNDTTYNKCYVVQNEDIIRAYDTTPRYNTSYNYRDYYIHSDYIYKDGEGSWSQYSTLPICLSDSVITNEPYYRVDFVNILIIFFIMSFSSALVSSFLFPAVSNAFSPTAKNADKLCIFAKEKPKPNTLVFDLGFVWRMIKEFV